MGGGTLTDLPCRVPLACLAMGESEGLTPNWFAEACHWWAPVAVKATAFPLAPRLPATQIFFQSSIRFRWMHDYCQGYCQGSDLGAWGYALSDFGRLFRIPWDTETKHGGKVHCAPLQGNQQPRLLISWMLFCIIIIEWLFTPCNLPISKYLPVYK